MIKTIRENAIRLGITFLMVFFTIAGSYAQSRVIKGKVVDTSNQPIIGAAVKVVGTSSGTITDANGFYTLSAAPKSELLFSFMGYKSVQENVGERVVVNVTMTEDAKMLQETVVIGEFGVKRIERSVGAQFKTLKVRTLPNRVVKTSLIHYKVVLQGLTLLHLLVLRVLLLRSFSVPQLLFQATTVHCMLSMVSL